MLVRGKYLCFALYARTLRCCANGKTILASEAEAPRVLRLKRLCLVRALSKKAYRSSHVRRIQHLFEPQWLVNRSRAPEMQAFWLDGGKEELIGVRCLFPLRSAIFRVVDE